MSRRHFPRIAAHGGPAPAWLVEHTGRNRHVLGPPGDVIDDWAEVGLEPPDLGAIRRYRLDRIRAELERNGLDGVVLHDPLNVKYATDTTNMPVWTMHNQVRYAWVPAVGDVIVFEFSHGEFLSAHSEAVDEVRPGISMHPFYVGDRVAERAAMFAAEMASLVDECRVTGRRRVGVDSLSIDGIRALEAEGLEVVSGHRILEDARLVKHREEIVALRCAVDSCERSIDEMLAIFEPGVREVELWAELGRANLLRHGEWMETRLLASGDRTNPWYQEASIKEVEDGEIMAFDTDMIGPFGMCVDMSRSWRCGGGEATPEQADLYGRALDMIESNVPLFKAGASYRDVTAQLTYPPVEEFNGYTVLAHGVGLCDEYPSLFTRERYDEVGFDGVFEPGMVMSVESFVGRRDGGEGVKLEEMILVTDGAPERLTNYPLDLTW